jgi:hypothetical protein
MRAAFLNWEAMVEQVHHATIGKSFHGSDGSKNIVVRIVQKVKVGQGSLKRRMKTQ